MCARRNTMTLTLIIAMSGALAATASTSAASAAPVDTVRSCDAVHAPHRMACMAIRRVGRPAHHGATPHATPHGTPSGYGPSDLRDAYGLPSSSTTATVAIVDAYDDPKAEADLAVYRTQYGLPACTTDNGCFRKVNQNGSATPLPAQDTGWAGEISLDTQMVSAVCPSCHILLVEAASNGDTDLFAALDRAVRMGARFVSNSWGDNEDPSQASFDAALDHPGVVITVSTGDDGAGTDYPATSRFVTAVGGTTLRRSSNARGWSESAWGGAGSGCSRYNAKPSWQDASTGCGRRADADVAAVADPSTGVAVYQSYGASGWTIYGGTSVAAPIVASVYALAGTPGPDDYPASYPYANAGLLHDVTSGHNGGCQTVICRAGAGWDGPTGLGTPDGVRAFTTTAPVTCPTTSMLGNGGFETGTAAPWSATAGVVTASSDLNPAHTGGYLARLDGTGGSHTDVLSQTISIPDACTSATLDFWVAVDTSETTTTAGFDTMRVTVGDATLASLSNLDHGGYAHLTVPLDDYIGHEITLTFTGTEDGSLATAFRIDDASVTGTTAGNGSNG